MDKQACIDELNKLLTRLKEEVVPAFDNKGMEFGNNRYESLRRKTVQVLDEYLPGESKVFELKTTKLINYQRNFGETNSGYFRRNKGKTYESYIESLIADLINDEYHHLEEKTSKQIEDTHLMGKKSFNNKIFIVHGHTDSTKEGTARLIERLGLEAIILHEQTSGGRTIIEKLEHFTNVGFAIVLYDEDDAGNVKSEAEKGILNNRARQNVVFEHGLMIGKLGRNRVLSIVNGNPELPSDVNGVVYASTKNWQIQVAKELRDAGYKIDLNLL